MSLDILRPGSRLKWLSMAKGLSPCLSPIAWGAIASGLQRCDATSRHRGVPVHPLPLGRWRSMVCNHLWPFLRTKLQLTMSHDTSMTPPHLLQAFHVYLGTL